jgi:hypothetical protein
MQYCIKIIKGLTDMKDYYLLTKKPEVKSVLDIYYRVEGPPFLLLKEFINIQTSGNPVRMIETNAMLVIAIAKVDWILAIEPFLRKFICINGIYGFPHYSLTEELLLVLCYRTFLLMSVYYERKYVLITNPIFGPLFPTIVATR